MTQPASKCPNCGALVELPPPAEKPFNVPCRYCQHNILVEPLLRPAANPFANQPMFVVRPPTPVVVRTGSSWMGLMILFGVLVPALVPLVIIGGQRGCSIKTLFSKNPFPLTCGLNEHIELDGKTGDMKDGPLIVAEVNCHVTIKNSKLKGPTIVKVSGPNVEIHLENTTFEATKTAIEGGVNLVVTMDNSKIEAKRSAIAAESNAKLEMTNGSKIKANQKAFSCGYGADVTMDGSSIEGDEGAIDASGLKVQIDGKSSVKSDRNAIVGGSNAKVEILGSSEVRAGITGIKLGSSSEVTIRDSEVRGKEACIDLTEYGSKLTLRKAKLHGAKKLGDGVKVDEN